MEDLGAPSGADGKGAPAASVVAELVKIRELLELLIVEVQSAKTATIDVEDAVQAVVRIVSRADEEGHVTSWLRPMTCAVHGGKFHPLSNCPGCQ